MAEKSDTIDLKPLQPVLERYGSNGREDLIPALFDAQAVYGYLPQEAVTALGKRMRVPLAEIYGVIEFYTMLYDRPAGRKVVRICTSPMCDMAGGQEVLDAACKHLGLQPDTPSADGALMVEGVPCLGLCDQAPAALVGDIPVGGVSARDLTWIASPQEAQLGVIGGEPRWLTARCGEIEPTDLEAFQAQGGYAGLKRALQSMKPGEVIEEVKASGLVGRGGAAFPTGLKWQFTAGADGEPKYIVCNADESEPGTFKDRVLMEGDPFAILEGMTIAAYAIGAQKGYLYIRGEYPRAQGILRQAIEKAGSAGLLGADILGSGFSFDINLRIGAGAYICGEETALFESIEGKRGFPRLKPPFPTTHGLFGKPTVINNVETLCTAAWILREGHERYRSIGTQDSPGSKLFCLSGDVARRGVYEVPFGTTLGELIELAGGVEGELQAILLGGAAGTFASPDDLGVAMSFEGLKEAGLSLGSGVVTVLNRERDLRRFLLSLAHFFAHESCGKCYPCQLGTKRQLEIISDWVAGKSHPGAFQALEDVAFAMKNASLCGLGMTAGSAVQSAFVKWPQLWG